MKEQIIRDGRKTCFRLPAAEDAAGSYRLQILNNNRPEQLLNIRLVYDGNEKFWEYAISGLVSLADAGRPELLFDYLHAIVFSLERLADSIGEYLLEADDRQEVRVKEDENSAVGWFSPEEAVKASVEPWFQERIYRKLNEKLRILNREKT